MKHPIASALLAIFLVAIVLPGGLNYSGFCFEQGRWLSDEEFLKSAVRHEARKMTLADDTDTSIERFLQENPQCCVLERRGPGMGGGSGTFMKLLSMLMGLSYANVSMHFPLNEHAHRQAKKDDYGESYLTINSCGNVGTVFSATTQKKHTRYMNAH